jgi:hypothetical protein
VRWSSRAQSVVISRGRRVVTRSAAPTCMILRNESRYQRPVANVRGVAITAQCSTMQYRAVPCSTVKRSRASKPGSRLATIRRDAKQVLRRSATLNGQNSLQERVRRSPSRFSAPPPTVTCPRAPGKNLSQLTAPDGLLGLLQVLEKPTRGGGPAGSARAQSAADELRSCAAHTGSSIYTSPRR